MTQENTGSEGSFRRTIAADARFCLPDYSNDQIWELNIEEGEPRALSLQTTFGLRARWMRLFPRFIRKDEQWIDPTQFHRTPSLKSCYPNYLALSFSPFAGLDVLAEYWSPESHAISGRFSLTNSGESPASFRFEWIATLSPLPKGESILAAPIGNGLALQGKTGNLAPVCLLSGVPELGAGPFPGLALDLELAPGETRTCTWALAALTEIQESFELARRTLTRPWEAEIARLEMGNAGQMIEIQTGDRDWDAAFALSQKVAWSLVFPAGRGLPHSSFVLARHPDHGYSTRGDGADHPYLWSGQTPLDALYLANILLPGGASLCEGILRNFLSTQSETGFIDWKPGLGGQRSQRLAQPLLASLALQIDACKDDPAWLVDIYPGLLRFVQAWFEPGHDRDQDGYPEWDHPLQTGLEDAPLYDRWHSQAQGVDITTLESPSLAAFLYRECISLVKIAGRIGTQEGLPWLQTRIKSLRKEVESTWDKSSATYRYREYQTHDHSSGVRLLAFDAPGKLTLRRSFKTPRRLLVRLECQGEGTRPASVTITGEGPGGAVVEQISANRFFWVEGTARATTTNLFRKLKRVEIGGIQEGDTGALYSIDYTQEDLSLLLPLWAGIPDGKRAKTLVENTLTRRYLLPFGLPVCPHGDGSDTCHDPGNVLLPWNMLLLEGLVSCGFQAAAASLYTRLMSAILPVFKQTGGFRAGFDAATGVPFGERNVLQGLPPVNLFLRVLGIRQIKNNEAIFEGFNPFPWPVTVKYQGMSITRHANDTVVNFSNGQTATVDGAGPHRVSLS